VTGRQLEIPLISSAGRYHAITTPCLANVSRCGLCSRSVRGAALAALPPSCSFRRAMSDVCDLSNMSPVGLHTDGLAKFLQLTWTLGARIPQSRRGAFGSLELNPPENATTCGAIVGLRDCEADADVMSANRRATWQATQKLLFLLIVVFLLRVSPQGH